MGENDKYKALHAIALDGGVTNVRFEADPIRVVITHKAEIAGSFEVYDVEWTWSDGLWWETNDGQPLHWIVRRRKEEAMGEKKKAGKTNVTFRLRGKSIDSYVRCDRVEIDTFGNLVFYDDSEETPRVVRVHGRDTWEWAHADNNSGKAPATSSRKTGA